MENDSITFHPLDQFTVSSNSGLQLPLIWLEASMLIVQVSIVCLALMAFPLWRILPSVGLSKWWALAAVFPPFALILFWIAGMKHPSTME